MLAVIEAAAIFGIEAYGVRVEVNVAQATVPQFSIVGLPDTAVQESRERVRTAIRNSGYSFPFDKRIIVNLAPADLKKAGPAFDLPIALGVLAATAQVPAEALFNTVLVGELGLDGAVRPISGVLPLALWARRAGRSKLIVPMGNVREAAIVGGIDVYPVEHLGDVLNLLTHPGSVVPVREDPAQMLAHASDPGIDFADVKGQAHVKRALEVAAAGGHNVLLVGSPGSGKTMLARRLPTILPPLSVDEALEATQLYSVAGRLPAGVGLISQRPFRSPHHTISHAGLTGGGSIPRPGEISLAHHGVLFLDELAEFHRDVLEVLRQPLEDGEVTIARAAAALTYPARFTLIGAMNPCPCGRLLGGAGTCTCSSQSVQRYLSRLSGPLLDRLDIHIEVPTLRHDELSGPPSGEKSARIRARVDHARTLQRERFDADWNRSRAEIAETNAADNLRDKRVAIVRRTFCNAQMTSQELQRHCDVTPDAKALLSAAITTLKLSARSYDRILKVGRTIADLSRTERIEAAHIAEAVQYRALDRRLFQS